MKNKVPGYVEALKTPGSRLEETHISWVVVGPRLTYKIKKPVRFSFVDFTTLAKRRHFCQEEVRLNQRYSPSIYLKTAPLRQNGRLVDYAVVMKTLPAAKRLDRLLAKNKVTPAMIKKLAAVISRFHARAKTSRRISSFGRPEHLRRVYERDFRTIEGFIGKTITKNLYRRIRGFTKNYLQRRRELFLTRVRQKSIRDLHGDLHSENIFYTDRPYLFDCVEFNPDFRYIDRAAEISFLLTDLEFRGKRKLAKIFFDTYLRLSRDQGMLKLMGFYKCHFAVVGGLVCTLEGKFGPAKKHFRLAGDYAAPKPILLAVGGLIGTGKSTLARGLAKKLGAKLYRSDKIRQSLTTIQSAKYSPVMNKKTYRALFSRATKSLRAGENVILDASFSKKQLRKELLNLTARLEPEFNFIETISSDKTILKRLAGRGRQSLSDARPWLLKPFKQNYEPPKELPAIRISTEGKKEKTLASALKNLNRQ